MRIAAGIVGILFGIISLSYIGLIGGMFGSAVSWLGSGPWAQGNTTVSTWGQLVSLLSYLSGLLAIVGGIVAFSSTRLGGIILAGSAFSHWYLLGFGVIGNVFILPIGTAAAFAFFAARSGLEAAPSSSPVSTSTQMSSGTSSAGAPFDRAKWNALVQYDKDIAMVAEKLHPLGPKWLDELASSYLALNDKKYLPDIEQKIITAAKAEAEANERLKEDWRIREEEQQRANLQEQTRLAQSRKEQFELWRNRLWGNSQRQLITVAGVIAVALTITVALWPKKYMEPPVILPPPPTAKVPAQQGEAERQVQQLSPAVGQGDCKVVRVPSDNLVNPYKGGCKDGLADGHGSYTVSVSRQNVPMLLYVSGEFSNGKLNGEVTFTGANFVEGTYHENVPVNSIDREVYPDGLIKAYEWKNREIIALCNSDGKDELNCTDRDRLLGTH